MKQFFLFAIFAVFAFCFYCCGSAKEFINFTEVKEGAHLTQAKEIELDTFLTIWINNVQHSKIDYNLNMLYIDSTYTYFGKQTFKDQYLYKINNAVLSKIDYQSIIGDSIREKFYYEIIPIEDRNKQNNCTSASISINYEYKLIKSENSIEIKCHYKVVCEFIFRIIKQDYYAKYDIRNKSIKKK